YFVFGSVFPCAAFNFSLHRIELFCADYCLMSSGGTVFRKLPIVFQCTLCKVVFAVCLLQEKVSRIGAVSENSSDSMLVPFIPVSGFDAVSIQPVHNGHDAFARKVFSVNAAYDFSFFRANHICSVLIAITENCAVP